jgi:hypothetical protein
VPARLVEGPDEVVEDLGLGEEVVAEPRQRDDGARLGRATTGRDPNVHARALLPPAAIRADDRL